MSDLTVYGHLTPSLMSETRKDARALVREHVLYEAQLHEESGFDGVLVGASASQSDSLIIAAFAAAHTQQLRFLVAHRPSVIYPTLAARQLAAFDHLSGGRLLVHVITGRDGEQAQEGDTFTKEQRYERTAEHIQVLKQAWTSEFPFSFDGEYYQFQGFRSDILSKQQPWIPISFAGDSPGARAVAAQEADQYLFYAQPYANLVQSIEEVSDLASGAGRLTPPRFGIIARPILAATDELAWKRAETLLTQIRAIRESGDPARQVNFVKAHAASLPSHGEQQLLDIHAAGGGQHDRALWTGMVGTTNRAMTAALVGSHETVAEALAEYVSLGVRTLLIFGFEPYEDIIDIGRNLIPLVREIVPDKANSSPASTEVPANDWSLSRA
jgi:alkanesulfonate monooxygenase